MAISKNLEIKISEDKAAFTEKFYVYQNDRGIDLYIKVISAKSQIGLKNVSFLPNFEGTKSRATILKPNGNIIGCNNIPILNEAIKFTIDHSLTDELDEIGIYNIQFHFYDNEDNRITIPPVQFEVKELLGVIKEEA